MAHSTLVGAVAKLVASTGGLVNILNEVDKPIEPDCANGVTAFSEASADDCFVVEAALHSCSDKGLGFLSSTDGFSDVAYAQILVHCTQAPDSPSDQHCLLSDQARNTLLKLIELGDPASASRRPAINFAKVLNGCSHCPLELLCRLHAAGLLQVEDYIALNVQNPQAIAYLSRSLFAACQLRERSQHAEFTFSVFTNALVGICYPELHSIGASKGVNKVCHAILETLVQRLLKANEDGQNLTCCNVLSPLLRNPVVNRLSIRNFALELFSSMLSYNPVHKVTQAMSDHHKWNYKSCSLWLLEMYQKVMSLLTAQEVTDQLSKALHSQEVNWYMLLMAVSVYLKFHHDTTGCLTGLIERLLKDAFESLDMESLVGAFLLARHTAQEAPHFFPPYASWFEKYFGFSDTTYAGSSKTFAFLMKFLVDMVPFEQAKYLKAHLQRPAYATVKCRLLFQDYAALAKTRLQDLEVSGHKGSTVSDDEEESIKLRSEVEKALDSFEDTGKVPRNIIEASIFRKPYFTGQFIPVLFEHRHFPERKEVVSKMVHALFQHGKISSAQYDNFVSASKKSEEGSTSEGDMDLALTPFESLLAQAKAAVEKKKDCEDAVLKVVAEIQKLCQCKDEQTSDTYCLEREEAPFKEISDFLHFVLNLCLEELPSWAEMVLLSLTSKVVTLRALGTFLWKLLISEEMSAPAAPFLSQCLLQISLATEGESFEVAVHGKTYSSIQEAVFSELPLSSRKERVFFSRIAVMYLSLAGKLAGVTLAPAYIPLTLLKKLRFVLRRSESGLFECQECRAAFQQCELSPIKDWLQSAKPTTLEWVKLESGISDNLNSLSPIALRRDYLELVSDSAGVRDMCFSILQVLVHRHPVVPNSAQLQILLQNLFLSSASALQGETMPIATRTLTQGFEISKGSADQAEESLRFFRIYCHLPPYCLLVNRADHCPSSESVALFKSLINKFLVLCTEEESPGLILHLFRCLLQSNLSQAHAISILEECPLLTQRLIPHWKSLSSVLALESKKFEEVFRWLALMGKLFSQAEKLLKGSVEAGKKLCATSKPWLQGSVLAQSINSLRSMPLHYSSLKPATQEATVQFLLVLCQKQAASLDNDLQKLLIQLLQANPRLCSSLDPANFEGTLFNKLLAPLEAFLCVLASFRLLVDVLEHHEARNSCCISTTLSIMAKIYKTNEDLLCSPHVPAMLQVEGTSTVISASARLLPVLKELPQDTLRLVPKATVVKCPAYVQQLINMI